MNCDSHYKFEPGSHTKVTMSTHGEGFSKSVPERLEQLQNQIMVIRNQERTKKLKIVLAATALALLVCIYFGSILIADLRPRRSSEPNTNVVQSDQALNGDDKPKLSFTAVRNDNLLQDCQGPYLKRSFPDIDYALLGYNIFKGFPLSTGHDPGFTLPIFTADYRAGSQTADCRYRVPKGVILVPDVSCITSFSSEVVETNFQFSQSLAVKAGISGGGWGVEFSANAEYKEASSIVSTGESVIILSQASCNYYYMRLLEEDSPPLHPLFLQWIVDLNNTDDEAMYIKFFENYGTHFLNEVRFGASFMYEYKMASSTYKTERENGVNVAVAASYSGLFSIGGSFSMDADQKKAASNFRKKVETKTITIGAAPPSNGDALTWAATVKENPVPVSYELVSIEKLFTERFMMKRRLSKELDYVKISKCMMKAKKKYCKILHFEGLVDDCKSPFFGLFMEKTRLYRHFASASAASIGNCVNACLQKYKCVAVTFCTECKRGDAQYNVCYMYEERHSNMYANEFSTFESVILSSKIKQHTVFRGTSISGIERAERTSASATKLEQCLAACLKDPYCVAFTFCKCPDEVKQCRLYSGAHLSLHAKRGSDAYFVSRNVKNVG